LPPETVVLIEDETDLLLFPPLRSGWARRGKVVQVWLSGWNARRVIFGAMNLRTGQCLFAVREHQRSADFQFLLEALREQYGNRPIVLVLDEDASHTAKASVTLATKLNIQLLWLPKRSPELNPMDRLWGHGKDHMSANRQYDTIDDQAERFVSYLNSLSNQEALDLAGIHSKRFWLRAVM
jgi:transposase